MNNIRLGVNIDHVATLRNARGENDPSLLELAFCAQDGGADSITMHLREDRRHIRDNDIFLINEHLKIPINFEMALTDEMVNIALKLKPKSVCIVPEKREELTTEGGLNLKSSYNNLAQFAPTLLQNDIEVFLFIDTDNESLKKAKELNVTGVEVHTGEFARFVKHARRKDAELTKIKKAADFCLKNNLRFHAGHGLNYYNIADILSIANLAEVNIGHAIIARALKIGLKQAVKEMKEIIENL
ncbi:MAG: pyridoxine 5'-phosphate synthase [Spirochaetia bacterium]|nr:pyridoxine 5'-phosphate synthase [Spirochaetia bacterium]